MSNDDSFNDSDEVFSFYSSKSVMETFKAQLKKIVESNNHTNTLSHVNHDNEGSEKNKKRKSEEVTTIENSAEKNSVENLNESDINNDLEDSIEIIEECTPRSTRQSERLKKKAENASEVQIISENLNRKCNEQKTCRKRRSTRKKQKGEPVDEITLDDSPQPPETEDDLNPETTVKVIWKSVNIKKFQIRKFQKLSHIYELLSEEENVPEDKIILTFNNIRVSRNDTPDSLNLQVYHFLDGGVVSESVSLYKTLDSQTSEIDHNSISVKFQDANKKVTVLSLNKNEKLKVGMVMCSEQLEIPFHKIKFFFDGELISPSETPKTLGLENGEVIDIKITD